MFNYPCEQPPWTSQLDATSGTATAWNPTYTSNTQYRYLSGIIATGDRVFLAGEFHVVNGEPRLSVAAVDPASGVLLPWNTSAMRYVDALALRGSKLYLTGGNGTVAVDTASALTVWSGAVDLGGLALAAADSSLYILFNGPYLDPQVRKNAFLALDATTGALKPWFPHIWTGYGGGMYGVALSHGEDVFVGGPSEMLGGEELRPGLAHIHPDDTQPPYVEAISPGAGESLIVGSLSTIEWTAHDDHAVASCDLYLSREGNAGPWELLAAAVTGTNTYVWRVPPSPASHDCWLRVDARDNAGNTSTAIGQGPFEITHSTDIEIGPGVARFALESPSPNPVQAVTSVGFSLNAESEARLAVVDVLGREVGLVLAAKLPAGRHQVRLRAAAFSPGLYFLTLRVPGKVITRRFIVVH